MSAIPGRDAPLPETPGTRYTRALVELTRAVWRPDCTLQDALAVICVTAAEAMQVERVNVWCLLPQPLRLQCVHAYVRSSGEHTPRAALEILPMDGEYVGYLQVVRAIDAVDVHRDPSTATSHGALRDYLHRHGICSLLDAPVRLEGELVGVICHEQVGTVRAWTPEEVAFAGSMGDYVAMAIEVDRRHQAELRLAHLRLHDPVTDLPNRDYLVERVRERLATPHDVQEPVAVVHVHVALPYGAAMPANAPTMEDVMAELATRLRAAVGEHGALARVRADGFAILSHRDVPEREVIAVAERCVEAVRGVSGWHGVEASAAVGVAFARDLEQGDPRVLMRNAELASERAAAQGRHRFEVFDIGEHRALVERLRMEHAMRDALAHEDFEVQYQPEFDMKAGRWAGAEALVRWRQPGGLLGAGAFIDIAEESGLILPLGRYVLQQACLDACAWPVQEPPLTLRVNVSAQQFAAPGLVDDVAAALASCGLAPERLCLEVTETTLMHDTRDALDTMERLKALGVGLAVDDFGTGYSSLAYLKTFPIDAIKVDRSFVAGLPDERFDVALVTAIRELAQALEIDVVAEGVERTEQRDALRALGVCRIQGWLYAPSLDQDVLLDTLARPPVVAHASQALH
ncbi:putative bifunctional diguanylate cyclase/phosphodiesterase [Lysobacter niabensis]|uniref:putative bifunctional diguanylate cyclase/phosphodiesterase n=1 Tax=Agrilutibacter niabensis TaxID=380628 RepID=UPI00361D8C56